MRATQNTIALLFQYGMTVLALAQALLSRTGDLSRGQEAPDMSMRRDVYLGLGANLGDRAAALSSALEALAPVVAIERVSSVWDTAPELVTEQPRFLNAAAAGWTALDPFALLGEVKRIEREMGRIPGQRYGPRRIDIDLLLFGQWRVDSKELTIPHPRLCERAFALAPLAEIAPDLRHPAAGHLIEELLRRLPQADIHRDVTIRL